MHVYSKKESPIRDISILFVIEYLKPTQNTSCRVCVCVCKCVGVTRCEDTKKKPRKILSKS